MAWRHLPYYGQIHLCFPFPVTSGLPRGPTNYRKGSLNFCFIASGSVLSLKGRDSLCQAALHLVWLSVEVETSSYRSVILGAHPDARGGLRAISTKNWLLYKRSPATLPPHPAPVWGPQKQNCACLLCPGRLGNTPTRIGGRPPNSAEESGSLKGNRASDCLIGGNN